MDHVARVTRMSKEDERRTTHIFVIPPQLYFAIRLETLKRFRQIKKLAILENIPYAQFARAALFNINREEKARYLSIKKNSFVSIGASFSTTYIYQKLAKCTICWTRRKLRNLCYTQCETSRERK